MSVVYRNSLKNTRMTAVVTDIGATGKLVIGTTGMASTIVTLSLSATAGTVAGAGVLTFNAITSATAAASNRRAGIFVSGRRIRCLPARRVACRRARRSGSCHCVGAGSGCCRRGGGAACFRAARSSRA